MNSQSPASPESATPPETTVRRTLRALVIDDSSLARRMTCIMLQESGFQTRDLASANDLESVLVAFAPDVIVCDLLMPGRDGLSVCRALRAEPSTRHIPVVLATAKDFEGDKRAALEAGVSGYLVKPFTPQALLQTIEAALSTQCAARVWGCRGSIAAPEKAGGKYGGNTSCVQVELPHAPEGSNAHLVFDAGTGFRALGNALASEAPLQVALYLTHFHWDHVQGLPFFKPLYIAANDIRVHGPAPDDASLHDIIRTQMGGAFFPTSTDAFRAAVKYYGVQEGEPTPPLDVLSGVQISALYAMHPGVTLAYRVDVGEHSFVYAPDNELMLHETDGELEGEALRFAGFARGASLLLHDCQYDRQGYASHRGWGHSCAPAVAAVAAHAKVGRVLLFHHDPDHEDAQIEAIHDEFRVALDDLGADIASEPAREGQSYTF